MGVHLHPFETRHLVLPKLPEPVSLHFETGGQYAVVTFDANVFLGAMHWNDFNIRWSNQERTADGWAQSAPNNFRVLTYNSGPDVGPNHCQYKNLENRLTDALGRPIPAFDIFE